MTKHNAPERAAALIHQAVDVLQRARHAPASPISTFTPAKVRRQMRRNAARLRAGEVVPRHPNIIPSAEELADVLERTARRDEIFEQGNEELRRISLELRRIVEENDPAVAKAIQGLLLDAIRAAEQRGPGSDAAERFQQMLHLTSFGRQSLARQRRQKDAPVPQPILPPTDPSFMTRYMATACEILETPPSPDEPVVMIPPEGSGSGRKRMFLRIGTGKLAWTGSFERGNDCGSTVLLMPDGKLFVSAAGAGYVLEASSRTLVETIGMDVRGVTCNEPRTLFVVNHDGKSLEAFGRNGRLWKTRCISSGGFRNMNLSDRAILGELRRWWRTEWVKFAVNLATGEVRFER